MKQLLFIVAACGVFSYAYLPPQAWERVTEASFRLVQYHKVAFYRWQDTDGMIQLTAEPPPAGVPYTVVEMEREHEAPNASARDALHKTTGPQPVYRP